MRKYLFKSKGLLFLNLILAIIASALGVYFAFILGQIVDVSISKNFLEFKSAYNRDYTYGSKFYICISYSNIFWIIY